MTGEVSEALRTGAVPVIIPAYEPDERLLSLIDDLRGIFTGAIVVVDDGSGAAYRSLFDAAKERGCLVLRHDENRGKGCALKTAMADCIERTPALLGCVTADSDGQHSAQDILAVAAALRVHGNELILGVRTFDDRDVPWKSRMGNRLTRFVCRTFAGIDTQDTQTGLRGIPLPLMRECLALPGDRFEFEMQMLLFCRGRYAMRDVPIRTIYDSAEHHGTHFDPVRDSVKIYAALFREMSGGKYGKKFASR